MNFWTREDLNSQCDRDQGQLLIKITEIIHICHSLMKSGSSIDITANMWRLQLRKILKIILLGKFEFHHVLPQMGRSSIILKSTDPFNSFK